MHPSAAAGVPGASQKPGTNDVELVAVDGVGQEVRGVRAGVAGAEEPESANTSAHVYPPLAAATHDAGCSLGVSALALAERGRDLGWIGIALADALAPMRFVPEPASRDERGGGAGLGAPTAALGVAL